MTENFSTDTPNATSGIGATETRDSDSPSGSVDIAKDQASSVGHNAAEAGQHVAAVAQDQAKNVIGEAGDQAKDLLSQARSELSQQATAQQQRLAASLRALGDELHSMTKNVDQPGVATDLARQGAGRSRDIASWLEDREPGQVVDELQTFARRRPGTFLLAAAGAGLLAGRLTRGVKDAGNDETETPPAPAQTTATAYAPAETPVDVEATADTVLVPTPAAVLGSGTGGGVGL